MCIIPNGSFLFLVNEERDSDHAVCENKNDQLYLAREDTLQVREKSVPLIQLTTVKYKTTIKKNTQ